MAKPGPPAPACLLAGVLAPSRCLKLEGGASGESPEVPACADAPPVVCTEAGCLWQPSGMGRRGGVTRDAVARGIDALEGPQAPDREPNLQTCCGSRDVPRGLRKPQALCFA